MDQGSILGSFDSKHAALWGQQPLKLVHNLHQSLLFSREALAELIEHYPREHYSLVHMGAQQERRLWREGEINGLSGQEVMDAISIGRMWLNMRNVAKVDSRYKELLDQLFDELAGQVPGFQTFNQHLGILISSPRAQVYYHADLPGQSLWQIAGRKRVFVYPKTAPFLAPEHLEGIALNGVEIDMPYADWYDEHALVFDLEPGQWLHWPLNAPHRVENHNTLNVSMTIEYWTDEIRRLHMVNVANGILRQKLGLSPRERIINGPSFWTKAVLQKVARESGWLKRKRIAHRPIDFRLDRLNPGTIVDLRAAS